MAAPRLKKTTRSRARTSTQIVPKPVQEVASRANDGLSAARKYAMEHPLIAVAAGAAVLAAGWSARRFLLPLAATAAVERLLPGSTQAMSFDGLAKSVNALKSSLLR